MPDYKKFQESSIFADNFINQTIDKLMAVILNYFEDAEESIYIAGSVAKNMQDVINKPVKDIDIIVMDEKIFDFLKDLKPYADFDTEYDKYKNRVYVKANEFYIEIWYNPEKPDIIQKYDINQKNYS